MIRALSLELKGYKAIYNGIKKKYIFIDFSKFTKRITLIKGLSGIGKSTIQNALSLLPENNNSFIEGEHAEKKYEFINIMTNEIYVCHFIHSIKSNGTRDSVKAYFFKTIDGFLTNMNPNGNLSSYKTCIENEFNIDLGFLTFSKITNEDKGIVDKTPAERKKYFNILLKNTEMYNEINKTSTKLHNQYKGIIGSITSKLDKLPDKSIINENIIKLENDIEIKKKKINELNIKLGEIRGLIYSIDPNSDIQNKSIQLEEEMKQTMNNISVIDSNIEISNIEDYKNKLIELENEIQFLYKEMDIIKVKLNNDIKNKEDKVNRLVSLNSKIDKFNLSSKDNLELRKIELETSINYKLEIINEMGINPDEISSSDYLNSINILKKIEDISQSIMEIYDINIIDDSINHFINNITISTVELNSILNNLNNKLSNLNDILNKIKNDEVSIEILKLRPKGCKDDSCEFIKNAISLLNSDHIINKDKYINEYEDIKNEILLIENELEYKSQIKDCLSYFNEISIYISSNFNILSKINFINPILLNSKDYIKNIKNYNFKDIEKIYSFMKDVNIIEEYRNNKNELDIIIKELSLYDDKVDIINECLNEISTINNELDNMETDIINYNNSLSEYNNTLENKLSLKNKLINDIKTIEDLILLNNKKEDIKNQYIEIRESILKIKEYNNDIISIENEINMINQDLSPLETNLVRMKSDIISYDEYINELNIYNDTFQQIQLIKKYSTPTSMGIQVIFMRYYLNNILDLSNQFLANFFNGEFILLPDTGENPNEFRIPCQGLGILHDDISSMSYSQRCVISMILSISLYCKASDIYKVLLLDEIDSGLDNNQRIIFASNIDYIADTLGITHIIITSHNNEFNESYCDIINMEDYL